MIDEAFGDFRLRRIEETPVLVLAGEIDISNVSQLQKALEAIGVADLAAIDMSAVEFVDSTALSMLVRFRKAAAARGMQVALVIVNPLVQRLFHITNFDREFTIVGRLEDVPGLYPRA